MPNTNCLIDRACPKCGYDKEVRLNTRIWIGVTDEGTDAYADIVKNMGDQCWEDTDLAQCPECGYDGIWVEWTEPLARTSTPS